MIDAILDVVQSALILFLSWELYQQRKTLRVVALMAAETEKEPEAVPDPEKARKAAEAIDKFNDGITNILNYTGEAEK